MLTLTYIGIANGMISLVIAKSKLFETFRDFFFNQNNKKPYGFIFDLISCPYCVSHWLAIFMTFIWPVRLTNSFALADFIVAMFVNVAVATLTWAITFGLMNWADGK
jgi:hypothetical protein